MKEYQPYTDVMYVMTGYLVSDVDEERYPHFDIFMNENILFHTLEEAERKIAELSHNIRTLGISQNHSQIVVEQRFGRFAFSAVPQFDNILIPVVAISVIWLWRPVQRGNE